MTEEQRSSLEARARADLAIQGVWSGALQIHCAAPLLVVEYSKPEFAMCSRSAPLPADATQWVEHILGLIHDATTANGELPAVQQNTVQTSVAQPPSLSTPGVMPLTVPAPAPSKSRKIEQARQSSSTSASNAPGGRLTLKPAISIGVCTEIWPKLPNALLGPCVSTGLRLNGLWRLAATGGMQWAAVQTDSIAIRNWHVGLDIRYGRTYWIAISAE